jgi:hypothetical protein
MFSFFYSCSKFMFNEQGLDAQASECHIAHSAFDLSGLQRTAPPRRQYGSSQVHTHRAGTRPILISGPETERSRKDPNN